MKTRKELLQRAEDLLYVSGGETTMLVVATANGLIALARELREGAAPAAPAARPAAAPAVGGAVFPFGKTKGEPITSGSDHDLEYFAGKARETLTNPEKQRFHAKEQILLDALNAEIMRRGGAPAREEPPPPDDLDVPF